MQKRTAEEVERMLKGYEESGLSRQQYCRREGIAVTTLDYYHPKSGSRRKPGKVEAGGGKTGSSCCGNAKCFHVAAGQWAAYRKWLELR